VLTRKHDALDAWRLGLSGRKRSRASPRLRGRENFKRRIARGEAFLGRKGKKEAHRADQDGVIGGVSEGEGIVSDESEKKSKREGKASAC